ncbi:MAG TPA: non-canonical purine NTP pyrophosphatase [Verrucomicrobiota bacterium]|nr:non-canonical purine NTP pyrophosphatase [Verrucomicrobiota bacterium]HNU52361.1 non-canonical purine NTP pyrophosphatase [Verrucomicrobiota bacterium]
MLTILIATRNRHKVGEIQALLDPALTCRSLADYPDAPSPVEDATTFAGNAAKKARALAEWLSQTVPVPPAAPWLVLADDSGLEVDALNGDPGVFSARYAARTTGYTGNSTDADNNAALLRQLEAVPPHARTARFRCAIAAVPVIPPPAPVPDAAVFQGTCEGHVLTAPRGQAGFGYDPLFQPVGFNLTFAEMGDTVKNRISHRARALAQLADWLKRTCPGSKCHAGPAPS